MRSPRQTKTSTLRTGLGAKVVHHRKNADEYTGEEYRDPGKMDYCRSIAHHGFEFVETNDVTGFYAAYDTKLKRHSGMSSETMKAVIMSGWLERVIEYSGFSPAVLEAAQSELAQYQFDRPAATSQTLDYVSLDEEMPSLEEMLQIVRTAYRPGKMATDPSPKREQRVRTDSDDFSDRSDTSSNMGLEISPCSAFKPIKHQTELEAWVVDKFGHEANVDIVGNVIVLG